MRALILAAGLSSRMRPLNGTRPKCLLKLHGKTMLRHQVDLLNGFSINDVWVATGFAAPEVEAGGNGMVNFLFYPGFASTNNLHTLHHCRHLLDQEIVILFSDVLIEPSSLNALVRSKSDFGLLVDSSHTRAETMRVRLDESEICDIGNHISVIEGDGNFVGIAKLSALGAARLAAELTTMVDGGGFREDYYTAALPRLRAAGFRIEAVLIDGRPWLELDTAKDYQMASRANFFLV